MKQMLMVLSVMFGLVHSAQADEFQPYVGVGVGHAMFLVQIAGQGEDTGNTIGGYGSIGFDYGDFLGAELRIGATGKASTVVGATSYDTSADWFVSYLAKFQYPVSEEYNIYALIGATTTKITDTITTPGAFFTSTGTPESSQTTTDLSLGFGFDYQVSDSWRVGAELMAQPWFSFLSVNLKYDL